MKTLITSAVLAALFLSATAYAADKPAAKENAYIITLKGDQFSPKDLLIPAGQKVEITVKNETDKAAEFESDDIDREKVVAANGEVKLMVGPLKAGTYAYLNDYHEESKGTITAK